MENIKYPGKGMKLVSIILGTLIGGFMWRCRGETGFGSSWGLFSVGLMFMMLIFHFYSDRKGMKYEKITIGALLTGLGVTGYGTVLHQTGGMLFSDIPFQGEEVTVTVNPYSGMTIMLLTSFTLVPLFAFFVGSLFSEKEYKIRHYVIMIAIYFGVSYLCKTCVSHFILKAINPEQVNYAFLGLKDSGLDYSSPMQAYLHHFGSRKWAKGVPFFENYYMSIESVSDALGVIGVCLYPLIAFKDKITSAVAFIIDIFTGTMSTLFTFFLVGNRPTGIFSGLKTPRFLEIGQWGLWEFATGASVGFITMLVLALLPNRLTKREQPDNTPLFNNKKLNFSFNVLSTCFIFGVVPFRAIGLRFGKLFEYEGICPKSPSGDIIMVAGAVILSVFLIVLLVKNLLKNDRNPMNRTPLEFTKTAFPAYFLMCVFAYFVLNRGYVFHLPYSEMTSISKIAYIFTGGEYIEFTVMLVTLILVIPIYIILRKRMKKL